jgi:hypothetical protein
VKVRILKRDDGNRFGGVDGRRRSERDGRDPQAAAGAGQADRHPRQRPVADKVDLLIVGDGYTKRPR